MSLQTLWSLGGEERIQKSHWGHRVVQTGEFTVLRFTIGSDFHQRKTRSRLSEDETVLRFRHLNSHIPTSYRSRCDCNWHVSCVADYSVTELITKEGKKWLDHMYIILLRSSLEVQHICLSKKKEESWGKAFISATFEVWGKLLILFLMWEVTVAPDHQNKCWTDETSSAEIYFLSMRQQKGGLLNPYDWINSLSLPCCLL